MTRLKDWIIAGLALFYTMWNLVFRPGGPSEEFTDLVIGNINADNQSDLCDAPRDSDRELWRDSRCP